MNFEQAINKLEQGKKVRRPTWEKDSYWIIGSVGIILWADGTPAKIHLNQIKADDWELFKEKESLSDKIELMDVERGDRYHPMIDVKDAKEKIQNAQGRLKKELTEPFDIDDICEEEIIDKIFKECFGGKLV